VSAWGVSGGVEVRMACWGWWRSWELRIGCMRCWGERRDEVARRTCFQGHVDSVNCIPEAREALFAILLRARSSPSIAQA
jgi:hypothetical protein